MIPEEAVRRARLENLKKEGINPYPAKAHRSHMTADVLADFDGFLKREEEVTISGRVLTIRKHGGLTFVTLHDASGDMQVVIHRDVIGTEAYQQFHDFADLGDFYEFSGPVFYTKKGQPSVNTQTYQLLSKSLLPLPEKWHGLTDTEKRYRWRYLDFIANPHALENVKARSRMVSAIRNLIESEDFLEVETPILQPIPGGGTARPFVTHHQTLDQQFYLRIAPELYLKRLMVAGFEKVYELSRCFRNEGISPQHNPEFTQIEAYWAYATINDLMDHLERVLAVAVPAVTGSMQVEREGETLDFSQISRFTFRDIIQKETGIDLEQFPTEETLRAEMKKRKMEEGGIIGHGELIDHLWKTYVRPKLIQPTFVMDYPIAMKPLAKVREEAPAYSAGAQLVVQGIEIWNAFNELNDPLEQEARFREQEALRARGSEEAQMSDEDYLKALKHGMPPCAGYGLGIDRLAMILTGSVNLKEVILFPTLKSDLVTDEQGGLDESQEESTL